MRILRLLFTLSCLALLVTAFTPRANADDWDKKTIVTFSGPVTISGHPLDAGTYVFKLDDSSADRHIVRIFNADESHILYTILAMPAWRVEPTGKTRIRFSERAGTYETAERDLPEAGIPVKDWFYPGDNFGQEFLIKPAVVAQTTTETTTTAQQEEQAPPPAVQEQQEQTETPPETAQVQPQEEQPAPPPAPAPEEQPAPETQPTQMPQTASPVPLVGLIGLSSLGAALALREAAKRMS